MSSRYALLKVFCDKTGYTEKAVRRKIEEGIFVEGKHYRKAPDGHIFMSWEEFDKWVEGERAAA